MTDERIKTLLKKYGILARFYSGKGSPENVVKESPGAIYINETGGTGITLYVKETGSNTKTGWIAK